MNVGGSSKYFLRGNISASFTSSSLLRQLPSTDGRPKLQRVPINPLNSWKPTSCNLLLHGDKAAQQQAQHTTSRMSYFFSTPVDIDIVLEDTDDRQMVDVKLDKNRREKNPLYMDGESVKGGVTVRPKDGKRLEHTGIKVQFIGTIGTFRYCCAAHSATRIPWGFRWQVSQKCSLIVAITTNSFL